MKLPTPLALFTYNRPQHTQRMLDSLVKCSRLDECRVVIFSDAPRSSDHASGVEETRRVIHAWADQNQASVVERGENLGLAHSVVSGVSELCDHAGRVIVVEDDLILQPAFIHYMLSALDRFEEDERVAQISGYMYPVHNPAMPDAFFLPFISTWGWGTWSRAWKLFSWNASSALTELQDAELQNQFDLAGAYPYTKMLFNRLEGKNQSWGILFYWAFFKAQKLALYPRVPLVDNIGFDSGTHYHKHSVKFTPLPKVHDFLIDNRQAVWPASTIVDMDAYDRIKKYLRVTLNVQTLSQWQRLRHLLDRALAKIRATSRHFQ